ncbi:hypothetical protein [Kitasatospora cineracea]|uniref:Uncharacterized protein n=1 Tax=Kitasatospora cineracea TaxID=88074 RepID=A0A3N4S8D9_9ACTN|nr:hypothetical protein [Kitasatospora cineracea]RPE34950.1 hypothetical protein EDD38_3293 [Kitasatospora cineracea]
MARITTAAAATAHARRLRAANGHPITDAIPFDHDGQLAGWTWKARTEDGLTFGWTLVDGRCGYNPTPDHSHGSWRREAPKRAAIAAITGTTST